MPSKCRLVVFNGIILLLIANLFLNGCTHHPPAQSKVQSPPVPIKNQPHNGQTAPDRAQSSEILPKFPVERELKGGEKHSYPLTLKANDYLKLVVEQKGIDVVVRLIGPDGTKLCEEDNSYGAEGPETISFISEKAGTYQLEIESPAKTAPLGNYEIKLEALRTATSQEQTEVEVGKLNQKVNQFLENGKYDQALPLAQQALDQAERMLDSHHLILAKSCQNLGLLFLEKGKYAKAEPLFQRSLGIREKALGPHHPDVAQCLNNLGKLYQQTGDFTKAEPLFQRSLEIVENALGLDHPYVATCLNSLAMLYQTKGDYSKAERFFQRSLSIYEKVLGPDHPYVATSLNNLAFLYRDKGDYKRAEALYLRALAIQEKSLGPNHPLLATNLNNLANLCFGNGDYAKAEHLFLRSLAIYEKAFGPDHPNVATNLNNLAGLYQAKGDYARAEPLFLRSLTIYEKVFGPDHLNVALSLNNLGDFYQTKGDYTRVEPLLQRALDIREKALGPDHPDFANSLNNLGRFYQVKGDYSRAEPLLQRALDIQEKALGPDHPKVAENLNNLAGLCQDKGEFPKAEQLFKRSLAIFEKELGLDHPKVAINLGNLAGLYQANGDLLQAVQYQIRSNDSTERDLVRNLISGSENQKMLYLKKTGTRANRTITLHIQAAPQDPAALQAALSVILRRKGRALDAMTSAIETLRRNQDPETQKLLDDYASLAGQISVLTLRGPGKKKPEDHLAYLKSLEDQKETLETEISRRSAEFKAQTIPIMLEAIQKLIPAGATLVEYVVYQPYDAKADKSGSSRYAAYLLGHDTIQFADLGEAQPIETAAEAFRRAVRSNSSLDTLGRGGKRKNAKQEKQNVKELGRKLDTLVFEPVRKLLGPTTRVLLSPDGVLNLVPFDALVDDKGKYLVETYEFSYLTSGRDLLRLQVKIDSQTPPLILADPDYAQGAGPQLFGKQFSPLQPLVGTAEEGEELKTILPDSTLKMEAEATENVLKEANQPVLVHIATHGYFLEDAPPEPPNPANDQRLLVREDSSIPLDPEKLRLSNPLLRSYLFFAGANQAGSEANDGIMTALEAARLNLWGTKLVVLSACDTGLGDVKNGDGVYGLRRALVLAGSETQLVSLWPVSDAGTRDLMIRYYKALKAGEGRSAALRKVRLEFLKDTKLRHPYFWASFILSGEWANMDGKR